MSAAASSPASSTTTTKRKRKRSNDALDEAPAKPAPSSRSRSAPASVHGWPAPFPALRNAERFLLQCAASSSLRGDDVLLVPDKDADGLSAGAILYRTLRALGVQEERLHVHLMRKGAHPGSKEEREAMEAYGARWIVVLDQGSREGPALVRGAEEGWEWAGAEEGEAGEEEKEGGKETGGARARVHTMVLDHHFLADPLHGGPEGALMVNASHSEPVATTALLTWHICRPLLTRPRSASGASSSAEPSATVDGGAGLSDAEAGDLIDWLCLIGTMGDLGVSVKWDPPFPDLSAEIKRWSKKRLGTAIALLNAPRRTPSFDTITAWRVLLHADSPASITDASTSTSSSSSSSGSSSSRPSPTYTQDIARLYAAREAVAAETERCTHTPPSFSRDGRIALLRVKSGYQVHPSIATRWSGTLRGAKKLQAVMCANDGYSEAVDGEGKVQDGGITHFSCRIAQAAKSRGEDPNLIELLHDYAARDPTFLRDLKAATEGEGDASPHDDVDDPVPAQGDDGDDSGPGPPTRVSVGNFARGHRQASGGIIPHAFFERFVGLMEIGVKDPPAAGASSTSPRKGKTAVAVQSNTLMNYFKKV